MSDYPPVPSRHCGRCKAEAGGLDSSGPCVCGPTVPCGWCDFKARERAAWDIVKQAAQRYLDSRCNAVSDVPMPKRAQRIHGRTTYRCGRDEGHDGPHRWPADEERAIAEWTAEPTGDDQ